MLKKEVCKQCFKHYWTNCFGTEVYNIRPYLKWNIPEEKMWEEGVVCCIILDEEFSIYKKPPDWCLFQLEHII